MSGKAIAVAPDAANLDITVTSSGGGGPFTGKHAVNFHFTLPKGGTITISAKAKIGNKDLVDQAVVGAEGRNKPHSGFTAPTEWLDDFSVDLGKFNVPFLAGAKLTIKPPTSSGSKWDCCRNGRIVKDGYKQAMISGEVELGGDINLGVPLSHSIPGAEFELLGFEFGGEEKFGIVPSVSVTLSGTSLFEKKCDGNFCRTLTGNVKPGFKIEATAECKLTWKLPGGDPNSLKGEINGAHVDASAKGTVVHAVCDGPPKTEKTTGSFCANAITFTLEPAVTLSVNDQAIFKVKLLKHDPMPWEFWKGNCPPEK